MKPARCTSRGSASRCARGQRGDALLDSLVGVVLASIVGIGLSYTASRLLVSQRFVASQNAALSQMSYLLASSGVPTLCAGTGTANIQVGPTLLALHTPTCVHAPVTVALASGSQSVTLPAGVVTSMSLATPTSNTDAIALFGGNGVLIISQ